MIKSVETYGTFISMARNLHIINESIQITTTPLEKHNTKGIPLNMITVKPTLDKYINKGYKLISSDAVSFGWKGVFTIEHSYILERKQQKLTH